jgi:hypothetical protein
LLVSGGQLLGYLGGLAIAAGVGCGIAIASAQSASAAPAGTSTHTGTASSARDHKATTSQPSSGAGATPVSARSSAATPKPAVAQAAPRPASTSSATASATHPPGSPIVIFKNTHVGLPPQIVFFVKQVAGTATFTQNSVYDLGTVDQYDWNKLTGISFTLLHPDDNAIMIAWRYNVDTQMFEIGPYYNVGFGMVMPTDDEIISVPVGQTFSFNADYSGITLQYGDTTVYKPIPEGLHPNQLSAFRILSWFGGTSVAPKNVSYYMKLKPWWQTL